MEERKGKERREGMSVEKCGGMEGEGKERRNEYR